MSTLTFAARTGTITAGVCTVSFFLASSAHAQAPAAAPDAGTWIGSASAGLALTSGNSDTSTFNVAFDITRDSGTRNVMKWTGLYLRGEQNESLVANRLSLSFRDQFAIDARGFVFGEVEYLRDTFKLIDYLIAPAVGLGYEFLDATPSTFSVDAGLGAVLEKNPGVEVKTSMAVTARERLEHPLTATATLRHAVSALWRADEFADGLYTISAGLGTRISETLQLSVDVLDTFKNRPPTTATKKNDVAVITALTAKF